MANDLELNEIVHQILSLIERLDWSEKLMVLQGAALLVGRSDPTTEPVFRGPSTGPAEEVRPQVIPFPKPMRGPFDLDSVAPPDPKSPPEK